MNTWRWRWSEDVSVTGVKRMKMNIWNMWKPWKPWRLRRVQIKNKSYSKRQNSLDSLLMSTTWRRGKNRNQKPETERRTKVAEEKKKEKKKWILTLTSVTWVLKLELSHLMREASCPSFIGGVWSGAQLIIQKIWTQIHMYSPFFSKL